MKISLNNPYQHAIADACRTAMKTKNVKVTKTTLTIEGIDTAERFRDAAVSVSVELAAAKATGTHPNHDQLPAMIAACQSLAGRITREIARFNTTMPDAIAAPLYQFLMNRTFG